MNVRIMSVSATEIFIAPQRLKSGLAVGAGIRKSTLPWDYGHNAGALDQGTLAPNATYHIVAIFDGVDVDFVFTTSPDSPVLPVGYSRLERVGSFLTNDSSCIIPFRTSGDWTHFLRPIVDVASQIGRPYAVRIPLSVPIGIKVLADLSIVPQSATGGVNSFVAVCDPDTGKAEIHDVVGNSYATYNCNQVQCHTDLTANISALMSVQNYWSVYTRGWMDTGEVYA